MGLACFLLVAASAAGRDRLIIAIYAVVTTIVGLAFIATGRTPQQRVAEPLEVGPVSMIEE
jgi:uncharacterized membrane protein